MGSTDYLRLSEHKIFKELRESLPKSIMKTKNLLTIRDSVLFTWDFQNNYVMSLNIKAARSREGDNVIHQKLLPLCPPLFSPEFLIANESGTLLAVAGPNGVLVLQLPMRYPPYGNFENNKEVVYCRSYSLDERLLACSETIEVRQVKFHPASVNDNHILVLTSDNVLRLYQIENNEATNISVFSVGEKPRGLFPGSKTPFLDIFGEIAVDFDFGHPEISDTDVVYDLEDSNRVASRRNNKIQEKALINVQTQTPEKIVPKNLFSKTTEHGKKKWSNLNWPVYILRGDSRVYSINIDLNKRSKPLLTGPLPLSSFDTGGEEACAIVCLNTSPQVLCIALSNGVLYHSVILQIEDGIYNEMKANAKVAMMMPSKEIIGFETVELELGLTTTEDDLDTKYKCPIHLHVDDSRVGRYFATHSAGVHSIMISSLDNLQNFVDGPEDVDPTSDIFQASSSAEYLLCTKTSASEKINPVVGFSLYYEPTSIIALLSDGSLVTLAILHTALPPKIEDLPIISNEDFNSPLKMMLKEPFDQYVQKILKKAASQPVLKLPPNQTQEQYYELLQRAAQVFREDYFKHHTRAREEIDKRIQTLNMLKKNQQREILIMDSEREVLQDKASNLAEKYEDMKDRQDELLKRCENLLLMVSRKKFEPSDAEKAFMEELKVNSEKVSGYGLVIDKIKNKLKYQQIQMENWKAQEVKKVAAINETHASTIKTNLQDTTKKITEMIKEVNEYKRLFNLK